MAELTELVKEYFELRGMTFPDVWKALAFLDTEKGEALELLFSRDGGFVRNNPENKPIWHAGDFAEELGDMIMMIIVAGIAEGVDPIDGLLRKMDRKLAVASKLRKSQSPWNLQE